MEVQGDESLEIRSASQGECQGDRTTVPGDQVTTWLPRKWPEKSKELGPSKAVVHSPGCTLESAGETFQHSDV